MARAVRFLLVHFWLWGSLPVLAQVNQATFTGESVNMSEIILVIQRDFGYPVSHSLSQEQLSWQVHVPAGEYDLTQLLQLTAKAHPFDFRIEGNRVLLKSIESGRGTLWGEITDLRTGEVLIGATVYLPDLQVGAVANKYGFYSMTAPQGQYTAVVAYLGYEPQRVTIQLRSSIEMNFKLEEQEHWLNEVLIRAGKDQESDLKDSPMTTYQVTGKQIKDLPAMVGEADAIKSIQLLPGVSTVTEGSSGLIVRGGGRDQNLIILDEAPVYNPSHLFGFYSIFNPDALSDIQVYKGAFPARYGGRLSSVMDVTMREGNNQHFAISGGLGLISSRLTLESPLKEDRSSFIISGRRTYADLFMKLDPNDGGNNVYFYDLNAKWNYKINQNNRIYLSGYFGRDLLRFFDQYDANWGNSTGTLRWNHIFSDRLFSNFSLIGSEYRYQMNYYSEVETVQLLEWNSRIRDVNLKADFSWYLTPSNTFQFGLNLIDHKFTPGSNPDQPQQNVPDSRGLESALYVGNDQKVGNNLFFSYGLRYSLMQNYGDGKVYRFDESNQVFDSTGYNGGVYNTYGGPEPRVSAKANLDRNSSIKTSYARTRQYLQVLANSPMSFTAFDIHVPTSPNLSPLIGDQFTLGYFRQIASNSLEFSIEGYFKSMQNIIDYIDHANLIQNPYIEGELRAGRGKSYGLETMLQKVEGRLTGWIGYTWSRAKLRIPGINQGRFYQASWDRPHDVSVVMNYKTDKRWYFGILWVYGTGNAVTLPNGTFQYGGADVPIYSVRNEGRLPDYHRLDLSATIDSRKNEKRRWQSSWTFSVYNAYFRKNPISLNFLPQEDTNGKILEPYRVVARSTYVLGIIPAVTYNFEF